MNVRLLLALFSAAGCLAAEPALNGSEATRAEREGRELTLDLLNRIPSNSFTNTGTLIIKKRGVAPVEIPARFIVLTLGNRWFSVYEASGPETAGGTNQITILHTPGKPSRYYVGTLGAAERTTPLPMDTVATLPFAESDFWVCDLGLEFLRWPIQRLLKQDIVRGQSCHVLESVHPNAPAGAYTRVVSWLDIDTGGIVLAKAYDASGRLMKEFLPKRFKKIDGEWHLIEMRIEDRTTRSKTTILFDIEAE